MKQDWLKILTKSPYDIYFEELLETLKNIYQQNKAGFEKTLMLISWRIKCS